MDAVAEVGEATEVPQRRRPAECPVEDWLSFLGHRWNALVLWHLKGGAKRHSELAVLLPGVSAKVLSERLDTLVARGLVLRSVIATFPRGVRYGLSPRGFEIVSILDQIEMWSRRESSHEDETSNREAHG
ncbi:transcriptional regulator [Mesorhizobium plurifarium]|uniref:winged helix-turn-helix transcriptional regulator n=1 Tax=Sinorhizobium arboris TaxID=76745 RepID=UPI000426F1B5|nr:helix-turn-helix domain-containing protein [Sinorhizobium arboris]PST17366.1 transcriptional regulator [Mesorhizobium plurifarium]